MIKIRGLRKSYKTNKGYREILKGIDLTVHPGDRIAILGRNGAGKSTLIRLIGGIEFPDAGSINSTMTISWPLGYNGGMQGSLTGLDNILFLSRIYGINSNMVIKYVQDFTELGSYLKEPVKTYSAGMRGRLNFALSMAFKFDCLLIDEGLSAGDSRFNERSKQALEENKDQAILMVSHSEASIRDFCDKACVLENGILLDFSSKEDAQKYYEI